MSEHDKADQARKGLVDSMKGKAKELFGAITGNDSLTAEGQLEQTQAQERKEANSVEAVADAEAAQASREAAAARQEGAEVRAAVGAEAAAVEHSIRAQQAGEKRAAEQAGVLDAAREQTQVELNVQREVERAELVEREEIDAATEQLGDAVEEHRTATQVSSGAQAEADRIRQRADHLTTEADLP
jgi:uncharacterized protein YjbJ (UPF0337 family)